MMIANLNPTLDAWIEALEKRSFTQLCRKPSPSHWSLGQVYIHLIENTKYFFEQASLCLTMDECSNEKMTDEGAVIFARNDFPDAFIEGPPENALTPQPASKDQLVNEMLALRLEANRLAQEMPLSLHNGKTKHPGLNYFNASEWFQFAEMHLRHHLRQKDRIDKFLDIVNN